MPDYFESIMSKSILTIPSNLYAWGIKFVRNVGSELELF